MKTSVTWMILAVLSLGSLVSAQSVKVIVKPAPVAPPVAVDQPLVQVALLLDNSGSMSGLIEQAKAQLWAFINEFALSRKDGKAPRVQVALFTYGTPPPQMLTPLTDDLDMVSEKLFSITINGGSEHCGEVIQAATQSLSWSSRPEDLKVIFIAGNEPFTQGHINYRDACRAAIGKGILVNTIHCGNESEGVSGMWKDGAMLADGKFLNIDQNRVIVQIVAPQDEELSKLSQQINVTYISYGTAGAAMQERQAVQDANAAKLSSAYSAQRAMSKGSSQYVNSQWDLVDAVREGKVKVETLKTEELPKEMQTMTQEERVAYIAEQTKKRDDIRNRIAELTRERQAYVTVKSKEQATADGKEDLQSAMLKVAREQAEAKQFKFEGK